MERHGGRRDSRPFKHQHTVEQLEHRVLLSVSPTDQEPKSGVTVGLIDQYGDALFGQTWEAQLDLSAKEIKVAFDENTWRDLLLTNEENVFLSDFRESAKSQGLATTQAWFDERLDKAKLKHINVAHFDWFEQATVEAEDAFGGGFIAMSMESGEGLKIYDAAVDTSQATSAFVTVHLDVPVDTPVATFDVDYMTEDLTAHANFDYQHTSGTLHFPDNAEGSQQGIEIPIYSNGIPNNGKQFKVKLSGLSIPAGAPDANEGLPTLVDDTAIVTIIDPVSPDDLPQVSISDASGTEGDQLNFTVTLDTPATSTATVQYSTTPLSASYNDFQTVSGTLTFSPSETTQLISVSTFFDGLVEPQEAFRVNLLNPQGLVIADGTGMGVIDDDPTPTVSVSDASADEGDALQFTVTLNHPSTSTVTVSYRTREATATEDDFIPEPSATITFNPQVVSQVVSIPSLDDTESEGSEYFFVDLFDPQGAVILDGTGKGTIGDSEPLPQVWVKPLTFVDEGNSVAVKVNVFDPNNQPIYVNFWTEPGSATEDDYSSMSGILFIPGGAITQSFNVTAFSDEIPNEGTEIFYVHISNPVNATIINDVGAVWIADQTPQPPPPKVSIGDGSNSEGDTDGEHSMVFAVTLSESSTTEVKVQYATSDQTALDGADYHADAGTLTFAPGTTSQSVAVSIVGDLVVEDIETFRVTLSSPVNAEIADGSGTGSIYDDDTASDGDEGDDGDDGDGCDCECDGADPGSEPHTSASDFTGESSVMASLAGGPLPVGANNESQTIPQPIFGIEPQAPYSAYPLNKIYAAVATLTFNGVVGDPTYYESIAGYNQNDALRFALQADATGMPTGTYPWSVSVEYFLHDPSGGNDESITREYHGQRTIVNRSNSPYGAGWWINELETLVIQGNNVTHISGDGKPTYYHYDVVDDEYFGPRGVVRSTLTREWQGSEYEYYLQTNGARKTFNAAGRLVSVADRLGNLTGYFYNGDGSLDRIADPFGHEVQFNYSSGLLDSVTDAYGRTTTVGMNAANTIESITAENTDPGGDPLVNTFEYNAAKQMTKVTAATGVVTNFTRNADSGLVESIDHGGAASRGFSSLHAYGLAIPAAGIGTEQNPATLEAANRVVTIVNENLDTATYTYNEFGYVIEYTDFNDNTTDYMRGTSGWLGWQFLPDPDGPGPREPMVYFNVQDIEGSLRSRYTLSSDGGKIERWIYDYSDGFRKLTLHIATTGIYTRYDYDPVTGELVSERIQIGQVDDVSNGETDDLVTTYTYVTGGSLPIGTVATVTDPMENVTKYEYFDNPSEPNFGRLKKVIRGFGTADATTTEYDYDIANHTETVIDGRGNATVSYYNGLHQLVRVVEPDPDGPTGPLDELEWLYTYEDGLLKTTTDPMGNVTTNEYDDEGRLHQVTMPAPAPGQPAPYTIYTYDDVGNVETINESGQITTYEYDPNGNRIRMILPDPDPGDLNPAPEWTYGYDALNFMTSQTDPLSNTTDYVYNNLMQRIEVIAPAADGGMSNRPTTVNTFDNWDGTAVYPDRLVAITDPMGNATTYDYDQASRMIAITLPDPDDSGPLLASVLTYAYDKNGNRVAQTDTAGRTTTWTYDALDRVKTMTQPAPSDGAEQPVTEYFYDDNGNLIKQIDPLDNETDYEYDNLNRLIKTTLPPPAMGETRPTIEYEYDDNGNRTKVIDPMDRETVYEYDDLNRLVKTIEPAPNPLGNHPTTIYEWDIHGNQISVTDPLDQTTDYEYDGLNRLITVTEPEPTPGAGRPETHYTYDDAGNRTSLTDPNDNTTTWQYDHINRVEKTIDPLSKETLFEYDLNGNLTQKTDRDLRVTQYDYDHYNRRTAEYWLDIGQQVIRTITTTYDQAGNLARTEDDGTGQIIEFYYDDLNRQIGEQNSLPLLDDPIVSYQSYDAAGRRTQLVVSQDELGLLANDYVYDNLGRMTSVAQSNALAEDPAYQIVPKRAEFSYNATGQLTALDRYNEYDGIGGVIAGTLVAGTAYTYDLAGRLIQMDHTPEVAAAVSHSWTYDLGHRVTSYTNSVDGTINYDYDDTNQLITAGTIDYAYDDAGNRIDREGYTYTVGDANRLESAGGYDYTYDDEGNMVTKTRVSDGAQWTYVWDYRNRLVEIHYVSGVSPNGNYIEYFEYDVFNRRIARSFHFTNSTNYYTYDHSAQLYFYDGDHVVLDYYDYAASHETMGDFELGRKYLYGPAVDQLLAHEDMTQPIYTPERVLWYLADNQNTTRDLVDNAGDLAGHLTYNPFGQFAVGDGSLTRYLYTGREYESLSGLQYNRNRWYNTGLGRWMSEDPIGFKGDPSNLYRYVVNRPTQLTDPDGLTYWDYLDKLAHKKIKKAAGVTAGGILQLQAAGYGIEAGAQTGVFFFPDTCEVGVYSIKAGLVKALEEDGDPLIEWWETGGQISAGVAIEAARFLGPGVASAKSFAGNFYTVQAGGGPVGGQVYVADIDSIKAGKLPDKGWVGGALGAGGSVAISIGALVWDYELIKTIDLDAGEGIGANAGYCLCVSLTLGLP